MKPLSLFLFTIVSFTTLAQDDVYFKQEDPIKIADAFIADFQFDKALTVLNDPKDSINISVISRKGHCYFRLGNYGQAIQQYKKILSIDSTQANALFQLAQLYSRNTQFKESEECFLKLIAIDSTNGFYHKQYGTLATQSGEMVNAFLQFQEAIKYNPRDVEAYILLGNTMLEMEHYGSLDSILTEATTRLKSPQLKLLLAKAQLGQEQYRDVIETTHSIMKEDTIPTYARLLGISYFELEEYDKAIPCMDFLIRHGMAVEWVYYYMGVSLREVNQIDSSIAYLNKAVDKGISENIHNYYSQLASTYEAKKDFKNSIKYYKAAYETSKADILLYHLARNYDEYYKDKAQAIQYYKRYLNSDDTIKVAKEFVRYRLDQLEVYR
jgi:tetratricopeptide (TPR) repeat protein